MTEPAAPRYGPTRIALVLPGGGARSAFQVGVLRAIAGWLPPGAPLPFDILCGTSAGAIIAAVLAADGREFAKATSQLARVWGDFRIDQVFRADGLAMMRSGLHLLLALLSGGWLLPMPRALLDNSPLARLLAANVDFAGLRRALASGRPESIAVTASSVTGGDAVTFVESSRNFAPWERVGRRGVAAKLAVDHLMASSAIPLLFPSVRMNGAHYGDGALRQATPLAPAIHLGADRILVVGVRPAGQAGEAGAAPPNMAEQFGFMLDALFAGSLQADLERLNRVNGLLAEMRPGAAPFGMRRVETLVVLPERDPRDAAIRHRASAPASVRALLRMLGARGGRGGGLLSYVLFEHPYTRELIEAGERDAGLRRDEICRFLGIGQQAGAGIDGGVP
jgi:NTE family protein